MKGNRKFLPGLIVIIVATFFLSIPTINNNIDEPNRIVYFNADEGTLMDIAWTYFSGERRTSYQWEYDYGLEMLYLADLSRLVSSKFINFTPGAFVLILRWIHLLAWIGSFIALWFFVSRHFGKMWQPLLAVAVLAASPAFSYFSINLKPEPVVLLFIILGLDYTLRIIDAPLKRKFLFMSLAFASLAYIVKFAGLFLLPAAIAALIFSEKKSITKNKESFVFKIGWCFPALLGAALIFFMFLSILFYTRYSTGSTFYDSFGFWGSIVNYKPFLFIFVISLTAIIISFLILFFGRFKGRMLGSISGILSKICSYSLIVCLIFIVFTLIFGFRWLISPKYFITTFSEFGSLVLGGNIVTEGMPLSNVLVTMLKDLFFKIKSMDWIIIILFGCYLAIELKSIKGNLTNPSSIFFKRITLLIFLLPFFLLIFLFGRIAKHNMLPFTMVMSVLGIQGLDMFVKTSSNRQDICRTMAIVLMIILFLSDILINGFEMVKARLYQLRQKEDVSYELEKWWRQNIPQSAKIVSDHYIHVYIPSGYPNVRTISFREKKRASALKGLVYEYRPDYVYYNEGICDSEAMPPIENMFPDVKVKLFNSFKSSDRLYQRSGSDKFVIYKVLY